MMKPYIANYMITDIATIEFVKLIYGEEFIISIINF